jgi:hypothetical protein
MSRTRTYSINESVFDSINTPEKAYILGFVYADGYNNVSKGRIVIALNDKDIDILYQIRQVIGSTVPIRVRKYKIGKGGYGKRGEYKSKCYLEINNVHISRALEKL